MHRVDNKLTRYFAAVVVSAFMAVPCGASDGEAAVSVPAAPVAGFAEAPLILFISIDTLRPDYLGCHGNSWIETPNIDALAAESLLLTDCMTVVPTTAASHTSMFTGKYPHSHGVPRNAFTIPDANLMLPEILQANGYKTVGIIAASPLMKTFNFDQGFDVFDDADLPKPGDLVTTRAVAALDGLTEGDRAFLFLHYWDVHHPRDAREPFFSQYSALTASDVYDGPRVSDRSFMSDLCSKGERDEMLRYASEVSYTDQQIGVLVAALKARGLYDQALIILTSDHGEGFLDHPPHTLHGDHVYQEQVSVPALLRFPSGTVAPAVLDEPTATIDLLPTLLHAIGVQAPADIEGQVILGTRGTDATPLAERELFSEATTPHLGQSVHPNEAGTTWLNERKRRCIRSGKYKYIMHPFKPKESPLLFDLSHDWAERVNLLEVSPDEYRSLAARLRSSLLAWTHGSGGVDASLSEDMTEEDIERLKALGYL